MHRELIRLKERKTKSTCQKLKIIALNIELVFRVMSEQENAEGNRKYSCIIVKNSNFLKRLAKDL